jgi:hypothetical protein
MYGRLDRWWWTVTGIVLVIWALQIYPSVNLIPAATAAVVIFGLWGLGTVVASLTPVLVRRAPAAGAPAADGDADADAEDGRSAGPDQASTLWHRADAWARTDGARWLGVIMPWVTAVMVVLAFVVWAYLQVRTVPGYGTDELAFNQYAAMLANHGLNPYTHSMAPSFGIFRVSPNGYTFNLNGTPVTSFSYPALAFQIYQPFLALGTGLQTGVIVNVAAWSASILALFALLPRSLRAAALVVGSLSTYVGFAVGGVTDAVYIPLLIGAAYHWYRFASQRGPRAWIGPVLFGLAMAMKQTPWFILPFVLAGIAGQVRVNRGTWGFAAAGRYLAIALAAFAVPNAIYIIHSPHAWLSGLLTPFSSHTVPAGQGLIGLSLFARIGGGSLTAYSVTAAVTFVALWCVYVASYPRVRTWTFVVPALALFFATRSFSSYLVILLPLGLLAAATDDDVGVAPVEVDASGAPAAPVSAGSRVRKPDGPWRYWPAVAAGGLVAVAVSVVVTLSAPAPLSIQITGIHTTGQVATVEQISVRVQNRSGAAVRPSFTVASGGVISAFWPTAGHAGPIPAHGSAAFTLLSPNYSAQPGVGGGFNVTAFTEQPATVSTSAAFHPIPWHIGLTPNGLSAPVALGAPVTLHAQLLDQFNRPVRRPDVSIIMDQSIYSQQGLVFGTASINGTAPGTTPVVALTDPSGGTTFVIRNTKLQADPTYFEANLLNRQDGYPYGYSEIVPIRFVRP